MIKTVAIPLYFPGINEREQSELTAQLDNLKELYCDVAEFLPPIPVGAQIPSNADVVVFPQLAGLAYSQKEALQSIELPIFVITSEFGTVEMWDWEIVAFLRDTGLSVFSPYNVDLARCLFRAVAVKSEMKKGVRFLMFQDDPGEGMQAGIFKRFFWWEDECTELLEKTFGIKIIYKSYKELNERAQSIADSEAENVCSQWDIPMIDVPRENYLKSVKLYIAIKQTMTELGDIQGVGANCLNESFSSQTTPCLAWNMLYEQDGILWVCEGDTVSLISKYIVYMSLKRPVMMTNIYPFLVGMAALKHEKIESFPDVPNPDNHALGVHCGYFGFAPQSFCPQKWILRQKVLEIVDDNALMVDCEMAEGPVTLAKIHPNLRKIIIIESEIKSYEKYPGSDCRNGALIHFKNNKGHEIMQTFSSHHALIIQGDCTHELIQMSEVFGFETVVL